MDKYRIDDAGGRAMLKTTQGGLLVADTKRRRVLRFSIEAVDLCKLAKSLGKREQSLKDKKQ